jgi:protein-S-isoprenylcysteine O-methyltransferase Ste14
MLAGQGHLQAIFMTNSPDAPQIPLIPPFGFAAFIGTAAILEWLFPLTGLFGSLPAAIGGAVVAAAGGLIALSSVWRLVSAGTTFHPGAPNTVLVGAGLYRYSRNPIYLGLILAYLGTSAILFSLWALLALPLFIAYLRYLVIAREEAYLRRRFGTAYEDYLARVPRWL